MQFPQKFGRYLLVDKLASGGMAEIYKAKLIGVEGFEKAVVIKRIHPFWSERRDFISMLVDEAKILVHLNHPNIVQVFELGKENSAYFIAMEYVDGIDLRQLSLKLKASEKKLPASIAIRIAIEALRGLAYAHHRALKEQGFLGIVHRDISPQNILVSFDGEVKVTDFGIAKAMTQTHETQTGVLKGKYAYMSPEQALGTSMDNRSDLFSCGIVLFELLLNQRLFAGKNDLETLDKVRIADVPWPETAGELSPELKSVLERALSLKPADRYASAEEFAEALESLLAPQEKVSRRQLSQFIQEIFPDEIQRRRIHDSEVSNRTKSFIRQTKVTFPDAEGTVSLIEPMPAPEPTSTVLAPDALPVTQLEATPEASEQSFFDPLLGDSEVLFPQRKLSGVLRNSSFYVVGLIIVVGLVMVAFGRRPQSVAPSPVPTLPAPLAIAGEAAATRLPSLTLISTSQAPVLPPIPSLGSLSLSALPPQANIELSYLDKKISEKGELFVKDLPLGTVLKANVDLPDYEAMNKTFEISSNDLNPQYVFKLKKKNSSFGNVMINAVPWGQVSMAGVFNGNETPVSKTRVPEGNYRVRVSNPHLKKSLSASAIVHGGKTTRCHADFAGAGSMQCR